MKSAGLLLAALLAIIILAQLACGTEPTPTSVATAPPPATAGPTVASPPTEVPAASPTTAGALPTVAPSGSQAAATLTQVIPPMDTLSRFSVECLESRLDELEAGAMFTPLLKALVECLTPQELADNPKVCPARWRPRAGAGVRMQRRLV